MSSARRHSVQVSVGSVKVGGGAPIVVQSMTNTDTADVEATARQVQALARGRLRAGAHHGEHRRGGGRGGPDPRAARARRGVRAADRRLSLQRSQAAARAPGLRRRARQVPHQPRQRRPRQQARPAVRGDDRGGLPARQAGAHRRELGKPGRGSAHAADGRELGARRAAQRPAGDAAGGGAVGRRQRAARRGARPAARAHHPLREGERCAGPDRHLPRSRRALRLPAAPGAYRGGHGLQRHRRLNCRHGGAAAGGYRRHHPRIAHARARRRSHPGGGGGAGDPADHGTARVHAAGGGLPRMRTHDQHLLPGARRGASSRTCARACRSGGASTPGSRR